MSRAYFGNENEPSTVLGNKAQIREPEEKTCLFLNCLRPGAEHAVGKERIALSLFEGLTLPRLQDWLFAQEVAPRTINHRRAMLHATFQFGVVRKIVRENPASSVEQQKVKGDKVGILAPDQMRRLLETATMLSDPGLLATFAIGGFAGVRPEEVARLTWGAIDLDHGQIDCGAEITKTAKHRYVKIEPALAAWLETAMCVFAASNEVEKMNVQGSNFRRRFDLARRLAGFDVSSELFRLKPDSHGCETATPEELKAERARLEPWPHDAFRHSYASYHLAVFEDAATLALQMGHQTTKMIFSNYRARVKKSDAVAWWKLLPEAKA